MPVPVIVPWLFGAGVWTLLQRFAIVAVVMGLLKFLAKVGIAVAVYDIGTDFLDDVFNPTTLLNSTTLGTFAYQMLVKMGIIDGLLIIWSAFVAGLTIAGLHGAVRLVSK